MIVGGSVVRVGCDCGAQGNDVNAGFGVGAAGGDEYDNRCNGGGD